MKSNNRLATMRRSLIGAGTGLVTAFMLFDVLDHLFFRAQAMTSSAILLAVVCAGAGAGAILAAVFGERELGGTAKHVVLGVLGGVAIVVVAGLAWPQGEYRSKSAAYTAFRMAWVFYGVPVGAVLGGIAGGFFGYLHSKPKAAPRNDTTNTT